MKCLESVISGMLIMAYYSHEPRLIARNSKFGEDNNALIAQHLKKAGQKVTSRDKSLPRTKGL